MVAIGHDPRDDPQPTICDSADLHTACALGGDVDCYTIFDTIVDGAFAFFGMSGCDLKPRELRETTIAMSKPSPSGHEAPAPASMTRDDVRHEPEAAAATTASDDKQRAGGATTTTAARGGRATGDECVRDDERRPEAGTQAARRPEVGARPRPEAGE